MNQNNNKNNKNKAEVGPFNQSLHVTTPVEKPTEYCTGAEHDFLNLLLLLTVFLNTIQGSYLS